MIRINMICEGETEASFARSLLTPSFGYKNIAILPTRIGVSGRKGGNVTFDRLYRNVRNLLLSDRSAYCTTFFDFYGLTARFPGRSEARTHAILSDKHAVICANLKEMLSRHIDDDPMQRFIPYVQMYEFEGLLFSNPAALARSIGRADLENRFVEIRADGETPEHINDDSRTAPSKRIIQLVDGYALQKPLLARRAALEIGLPKIRQQCHLFSAWLATLEALPPLPA